ncbi:hypothetical protein ACH3XW_40895 [Acanthocheilonema viteae]
MEIRIARLRTTILDVPEESGISQYHHANTTNAIPITFTTNSSATKTFHAIYRSFAYNISDIIRSIYRCQTS